MTRSRRLGIRSRLLGLVLVPSIGLGILGVQFVRSQAREAQDARAVAGEVEAAAVALEAFVATTQEFRHSETLVQTMRFGMSPDAVGALLGYDVQGALADARRRVDDNPLFPRLRSALATEAQLAQARRAVDIAAAKQPLLADLVVEARRVWQAEIAALFEYGIEVAPQADVSASLVALDAIADLFEADDQRMLLAADLLVPGSASDLVGATDLEAVQARYAEVGAAVASAVDEHLRADAEELLASGAFEDALAEALGPQGPTTDVPTMAEAFRTGLEHAEKVHALTAAAADDARHHAERAGAEADGRHRRAVLVLLGLFGLSVLVALAVAGSIAGPLRRVAGRAARVSAGDLEDDLLPEEGPRETAVLARTLNDAVVNLRAVAQRMAALAAGDLEGARRRTPGKLGELVGRSVDGLAQSLREREDLQRRLAHDAAHDALTGLANRRTTMHRLDALLGAGGTIGLLYLDLDGFKHVNDEFGHAVGDRLLIVAARRIAHAVPEDVLVARLGGDEFVVGMVASSEGEVLGLADSLLHVLHEPFSIDGLPHRIGVSIGVAFSVPGDDADRLLRSGDHALYAAKQQGRGGVAVLDAELRAQVEENHRIEVALREAIVTSGLELHYQPVFDTDDVLHGVEALVRWRQPDGTMVPPDDFIPVAERSDLIVDLDRWVLRSALGELRSWMGGPLAALRLSVNVSARTLLASTFVDEVRDALATSGVTGEQLVVEVTETALLHDLETAARHIAGLRELGVGTSVDDFGTGYTSVSHLRRLPVSEVKIDRSFVQAMGLDERDRVLVDLVARMGTVLGLDVVAEGVETTEQLDALRLLGCRYAQGFLLGRPMSPQDLDARFGSAGGGPDTGLDVPVRSGGVA